MIEMDRQSRIMALADAGITQGQIAHRVGISQSTVSRTIRRAHQKEETYQQHLEGAQIAARSADDAGELLLILSQQSRTQNVRVLILRTLRRWHAMARYTRIYSPDWHEKPAVTQVIATLEAEFGLNAGKAPGHGSNPTEAHRDA